MIEIIPTVVPASPADIEAAARKYAPFARTLHIDFADGVFAPNTTWMPQKGETLYRGDASIRASIQFEAHLMVADPLQLGVACARWGASRIIGHIEAMQNKTETVFAQWRAAGAQECGMGTLFDTPVESLAPFIPFSDFVMFMGITAIGVQGLPSDPNAPAHAAALRALYPDIVIEVDGAISEQNIAGIASGGATRFCAGSVLSKSPDPASTYRSLIALAESALE